MVDMAMNSQASVRPKRVQKIWQDVAGCGIGLLFAASLITVAVFQFRALGDMNPATWENGAFYGGIIGGLITFALLTPLVTGLARDSQVSRGTRISAWRIVNSFTSSGRAVGLTGTHMWCLLGTAIPWAVILLVNQYPHPLHTPDGHVRLMNDGRVLSAGSSVESTRYLPSSALVPLHFDPGWADTNQEQLGTVTPDGLITLAAVVDFTLKDGPALAEILRDNAGRVRSISEARRFFRSEVNSYLSSAATPLVTDLQQGRQVPDYTVRLTQLAAEDSPDWLAHLSVSDVRIVSGEHTYQ